MKNKMRYVFYLYTQTEKKVGKRINSTTVLSRNFILNENQKKNLKKEKVCIKSYNVMDFQVGK